MKQLKEYTIDNITIEEGYSIVIGEEYLLYINEIFEIDNTVFFATSTNKDIFKYRTELGEEIFVSRNIIPAELFIKQNAHLFENKKQG